MPCPSSQSRADLRVKSALGRLVVAYGLPQKAAHPALGRLPYVHLLLEPAPVY